MTESQEPGESWGENWAWAIECFGFILYVNILWVFFFLIRQKVIQNDCIFFAWGHEGFQRMPVIRRKFYKATGMKPLPGAMYNAARTSRNLLSGRLGAK